MTHGFGVVDDPLEVAIAAYRNAYVAEAPDLLPDLAVFLDLEPTPAEAQGPYESKSEAPARAEAPVGLLTVDQARRRLAAASAAVVLAVGALGLAGALPAAAQELFNRVITVLTPLDRMGASHPELRRDDGNDEHNAGEDGGQRLTKDGPAAGDNSTSPSDGHKGTGPRRGAPDREDSSPAGQLSAASDANGPPPGGVQPPHPGGQTNTGTGTGPDSDIDDPDGTNGTNGTNDADDADDADSQDDDGGGSVDAGGPTDSDETGEEGPSDSGDLDGDGTDSGRDTPENESSEGTDQPKQAEQAVGDAYTSQMTSQHFDSRDFQR